MKVSVIIVAKNEAEIIGLCLDSMLTQTYKDYEIIVVDGGSTDETADIVKSYVNKTPEKVQLIFDPGLGPGYARNLGVKFSRGEIITFMDGDDTVNPEYIENIVKHFKDPQVAGVFVKMIFRSGSKLWGCTQDAWKWMRWNKKSTRFPVAFRKVVFEEVKGYNPEIVVGEDYDLYLKIIHYIKKHDYRLEIELKAIIYMMSEDTPLKIFKDAIWFGKYLTQTVRRYPRYGGLILIWSMFNVLFPLSIPFIVIQGCLWPLPMFYVIPYFSLWSYLIIQTLSRKPRAYAVRYILLTPILQIIVGFGLVTGIVASFKNFLNNH